jgi:predicted acyl esterase
MRARVLATFFFAVAVAFSGGCSSGSSSSATHATTRAPAIKRHAEFTAHGSIRAAYVTDVGRGTDLVIANANGDQVGEAHADALGSAIFYNMQPGDGYTVRTTDGAATDPFRVLSENDTPDPTLYTGQHIAAGLNYVRMRDGIELAMTLRLPAGKTIEDGPFPTVIEYSGYQVAAPKDLFTDIAARLTNPKLPEDPLVPSTSTVVGSLIAPMLGYATVSVQMRGSGCSGGAFDLFDYPTIYDGYDAVETVAAQPWVKNHKVGMVGISFSGITQLFTGGTRPPHLAAVAPLSPTDDLYRNVGSPGGIFNNGFAQSWLQERMNDAEPAPQGGQPYAKELVKDGDEHCTNNQKLHGQTLDPLLTLHQRPQRDPELYDVRDPGKWGAKIDVPIFMANAFQDEQIIGSTPPLVNALANNPNAYITLMNGTHVDPLGPATITRWAEFLGLYVADAPPTIPANVLSLSSALYQQVANAPAAPVQQSRFAGQTDLEAARRVYRTDPRVRVLMDIGGGDLGPGALQPVWEMDFDSWPPKNIVPTAFFLGENGTLARAAPDGSGTDAYVSDASARPATSLPKGDPWAAQPPYQWKPVADGHGVGYVSDVLTKDLVVAGPASLDVFLKSTAADTDLQVTISEVRPDGRENYVQFGVLRASNQTLDPSSTAVMAIPTYTSADQKNLLPDTFTMVRVPIFPFAYAFRAGSRIRITIQAPGGERPVWKFETNEHDTTNTIARGSATPSKLMLAVVPGATAGSPRPACGAPRGEPCRTYTPAKNGG